MVLRFMDNTSVHSIAKQLAHEQDPRILHRMTRNDSSDQNAIGGS